jgi:membrane-bound lytic murein transglycosylase D
VNTLVDERRDPVKSSDAAARYLRDLYEMFGDWSLAIAAYNCGEGNIQKAILRSGEKDSVDFWTVYERLPRETRGYVPAFIAATYIMNYYCEHGIVPHEATLPEATDTVVVKKELGFSQIASMCNVTLDGLRAINPQYRRDIVPINHVLRLPAVAMEAFIQKEDSIYSSSSSDMLTSNVRRAVTKDVGSTATSSKSSSSARYVTVRNGDTLSGIAKRNGTTVAKIKRLNGLKSDSIRPKQRLQVR